MLRMRIEGDGLARFNEAVAILGDGIRAPINRAVNRAGDMGRTQVRRVLPKQTGLPRAVIVRAAKVTRSSPATLAYVIRSQGGDVSLKYFKARETRRGVTAKPFGKRTNFGGRFIKAGRFPGRVPAKGLGGHVYRPIGDSRRWGRPIEREKSGVIIPAEMIKGATAEAWRGVVREGLSARVAHEIRRATKGAVS